MHLPGKTATVVDEFREALRAGDGGVRLLVPTATMTEHLQHRFAREGFVFRPSLIQTLSGFVQTITPDLRQAPDTVLYLLVEDAVRRVGRPEFARVAGMAGFSASLSRTILEFASAGCDSARLAERLPEAPLAAAFLAVYREVDAELDHRGLVLRARRLQIAAERIDAGGLPGIHRVWLDGFHALPDPELRLIAALERHAAVTLATEDRGRRPAVAIVRAPKVERECDEIARRIVEQAEAGRPFREIGVIVRPAEAYVPILRATLERFGIPARFYFDEDLDRVAEVRHASAAIEAMLGGWDHAATLAALRLAPGFENSRAMDAFDHKVREGMPRSGLDGLRALTANERLLALIERVASVEEWRTLALEPQAWAKRVASWSGSEPFAAALDEAAVALEGRGAIGLTEFWRAAKAVVRLTRLHPRDSRRNVVNVLSAPEARQWALPVVFVCGLVEKQFPQFHRQDPFFPDAARRALNGAGLRVRTAAQFEEEERQLFDAAVSRATLSVVLTYPEFDGRGDRNLPSLFLEAFAIPPVESVAVRPAPRLTLGPAGCGEIRAPRLLEEIGARSARLSPSGLESFLQCPFQYFGGRMLRLKSPPARPEERLDFLTQGNIVHEVLKEWWTDRRDIVAVFEDVFARVAAAKGILMRYQTERARNQMLDDLRRFAAEAEEAAPEVFSEKEFEYALDGVTISGKIDRIDVRDGWATVIDYKYSNATNTKAKISNESLLQAPLYLLAAERTFGYRAAGMYYLGLKGGVERADWPVVSGWEMRAGERTLAIVAEIRSGRVEVRPTDPDKCRFCDVSDVCRVETSASAESRRDVEIGAGE
jgi:ATP-dependent helicase/DNAse subunit B